MERRHPKKDEPDPVAAEIEALRPYLDLAREIRNEVERIAADGTSRVESLVEALDAIPERERAQVAQSIFAQLTPQQQWASLEHLYGDEELRGYLENEREGVLEVARRASRLHEVVRSTRATGRLDLASLVPDRQIALGLFRPSDVRAAMPQGCRSDTCAREIRVRTTDEPGVLHVVSDVFNPRRGLFVTPDYDEHVWEKERLPHHSLVRIGSLRRGDPTPDLTAMLYPGARVDFGVDGELREGRLHLGFALVDDEDIFSSTP